VIGLKVIGLKVIGLKVIGLKVIGLKDQRLLVDRTASARPSVSADHSAVSDTKGK
jgi:hypothetical protein